MNLLSSRPGRGILAFSFYFAEGAPIGFIWWAMPTLLRKEGIEIDTIAAFTATLTLPWVFKFLWAPLVDMFRNSRFGYTGWIAIAQSLMCLTLLPLVFIPIQNNLLTWQLLLFANSICAATQDVSVDALVINVISHEEKGILNGYMQAGMLVGRSLFGGGAIYIALQFGLHAAVGLMILAILITMILLFFIREPALVISKKNRFKEFRDNFRETFSAKRTWFTIAFALTSAAAFEAAGAMSGPFLTDQNISTESISFFFGIVVVVAMLAGSITGGYLSDKISRKKSVAFFLLGIVLMVTVIAFTALLNINAGAMTWMILFALLYLFTGMFTASSYAFYMDVTNPRLSATEFSTFMAATNGCESWVVWSAGLIASSNGYSYAFLTMCIVSLLSLVFLRINREILTPVKS